MPPQQSSNKLRKPSRFGAIIYQPNCKQRTQIAKLTLFSTQAQSKKQTTTMSSQSTQKARKSSHNRQMRALRISKHYWNFTKSTKVNQKNSTSSPARALTLARIPSLPPRRTVISLLHRRKTTQLNKKLSSIEHRTHGISNRKLLISQRLGTGS